MKDNSNISNSSNKRIASFDFIRLFAIFSIVFGHSSYLVIDNCGLEHSCWNIILLYALQAFLRDAIPLLFMISGALMLNTNKTITLKTLYSKYILRLVLGIFIFGFIYGFIKKFPLNEGLINGTFFTSICDTSIYIDIFKNLITGNLVYSQHLWFLYAMVGVYILIPILKIFVNHAAKNIQGYFLILLFTTSLIMPFINNTFNIELNLYLSNFSSYLLYFLSGYYIFYLYKFNKKHNVIFALIFIITSIFLMISYNVNNVIINNLNFTISFIHACITFIYLNKIKYKFPISKYMNKYTYGIYLIHLLFLSNKFFGINLNTNFVIIYSIAIFVYCLTVSFIVVWLLKKIKFIDKYIL